MAQTKILLDTNSYLRLAENLHPLLFVPYGDENFTLYAHKDLRDEKSMFDAGHVTIEKIHRVVEQWVHDEDLPAKVLRRPYKKFFGKNPPSGF